MLPVTGFSLTKGGFHRRLWLVINSVSHACRNFGFGNLPNSGTHFDMHSQKIIGYLKICMWHARDLALHITYYVNTCHYDELTIRGFGRFRDVWLRKWGSPIIYVRVVLHIQVPPPPHPITGHKYIRYPRGIYMDLWDICETPASDLRGTCEQCLLLFMVASTCATLASHLRMTCEYDLRVLGCICVLVSQVANYLWKHSGVNIPQRKYFLRQNLFISGRLLVTSSFGWI